MKYIRKKRQAHICGEKINSIERGNTSQFVRTTESTIAIHLGRQYFFTMKKKLLKRVGNEEVIFYHIV